jgi:hypothetical protein
MRAGHIVDRHTLLHEATPLPGRVEGLDEVVLAVPRSSVLRPDPAPCFHNSFGGYKLPAVYEQSVAVLRDTWAEELPIATPFALIC